MNVKTPRAGMIAESVQGRDKGRLYAISEVLGGGKVAVADGVTRKLASPKIKNVKHLRLSPRNTEEVGITPPWDKAFDCKVAHFLKQIRAERADKVKPEE